MLGLIIVVAIAAYGFSIKLIRDKVIEVSKYQIKADEKTTLDTNNRSLEDLIKNNKVEIDQLQSRIVKKDGTVSFIDTVESYAKSSGISVLVENVEERKLTPEIEGYQALHLNVKTQGSWEGTYRFLSLLESLPYKLTIESAEIKNEMRETAAWNSLISVSVLQQK